MTAKLRKLRLPRKTVFLIGGVLLFGGATGACALYIGKDRLLGSGEEPKVAALACTTVKTVKIKKKDRYWVRKFIKTDPAEGLARVATALRVAEAVYDAEKPDLVQVVVLDQRGPEQRADMRGRAIGADVVYVPHPEAIPDLTGTPVYSAKYIDGSANDDGQFYGEKIQLPPEHIESLVSLLTDHEDCADPSAPEVGAGHETKSGEHGAPAAEHGGGEHGGKSAESPAEAHGGEDPGPAAEAHGAETAEPEAGHVPVYDEPDVSEQPVAVLPQASGETIAVAEMPVPAVSNEKTSAAGDQPAVQPEAHVVEGATSNPPTLPATPAAATVDDYSKAAPEHGAVAADREDDGYAQDFYDEPFVNDGN